MVKFHTYISHTILIGLIFLIMGTSLWSPGGIMLLDFIITPHSYASLWQAVSFPLFDFLARTIGYEIVSKGFFISILWSAGYLGILIGRNFGQGSVYTPILESIGVVFFLTNPYAYERMMVQPTIYMGAIALGYTIYFLLLSEMHRKYIWWGVFGGLSFIMMPHASYMIALVLGLYTILFVRTRRDILGMCSAGLIILLFNLNWLIAPLFGVGNSAGMISSFSSANLEAFETQALAPLDVWGTNILLYGFWWERYGNHYANVDFLSSLWWVGGFILLLIMAYGFWYIYQYSKRLFIFYFLLFTLSLIFGIGIASPITEWLTRWMIEYVPLWQWYREPQKWIGLVMIVEGTALIYGVAVLLQRFAKDLFVRYSIAFSVLLLLLIWTPGPLMGYHGQLRTTVYPEEFEQVRSELLMTHSDAKILIFPWHSYIGCSWIWRPTVANPIKWIMWPLVVTVADNIEVWPTLYSNSTSSESHDVEKFIKTHDFAHITKYNYSYILLMRECANSDTYDWLDEFGACTLDTKNRYISLYSCHK